ncbi:hypothetical protein SAMN04487886_103412 [Clostridium sp. DSM 8431]|uniref:hypothetical protein n=1 Tax=Clostridium sp. DSM 8431 TaxID=1761781 RepID=UPI0008E7A38C|nr:hypothetical protein [Clostridium sp. DSM 8431]SFU46525.1 hypothetical protein SAMN04487886_103412 [Clostridium sp. DSM 8431]
MKLFKKITRKKERKRYARVDKLVDEIFELSKEFSNENGEYPRSFNELNDDVFYLDSSRYEIEITLNRLKLNKNHFYYKYKPIGEESEDEKCFANSLGAFVEIFENFKKLYDTPSKYDYGFLNKVCNKCFENLTHVIEILRNQDKIIEFLNYMYATEDKKKREYKQCLDYINKEKIIKDMIKIVDLIEMSSIVLPEHIDSLNFDYARMTTNYIEEECTNLLSKLEKFQSYNYEVKDEKQFIHYVVQEIDKIRILKKPIDVDISIIKLNCKCGQPVDREDFDKNVVQMKKEVKRIKKTMDVLLEEYKEINKIEVVNG